MVTGVMQCVCGRSSNISDMVQYGDVVTTERR